MRVLNRLITWCPGEGIKYEADPRHAQILIKEVLEGRNKKAVVTPAVRVESETDKTKEEGIREVKRQTKTEPEEEHEATRYRGLAARANFLAIDRPEIQFAVKETCRRMSSPCKRDWDKTHTYCPIPFGRAETCHCVPS